MEFVDLPIMREKSTGWPIVPPSVVKAKKETIIGEYLKHLKEVVGNRILEEESRTSKLPEYQRLTRDALLAATWLKRYAEALIEDAPGQGQNTH